MCMRRRSLALTLGLLATLFAGCDRYPQDPHHTLDRVVQRGTLRVGVASAPPWVAGPPEGEPGGVEADLLRSLARDLDVEVVWEWGSEGDLLEALTHYELDIVAGGITASTPWKSHLAVSVPYYTSHSVVGVGPAASLSEGAPVAVHPASGLTEALREHGFDVHVREDLASAEGPVAAEAWEVEGLGLRPSGPRLRTEKHVMVVPLGENAMLMKLEDTLLRVDSAWVGQRLREAPAP